MLSLWRLMTMSMVVVRTVVVASDNSSRDGAHRNHDSSIHWNYRDYNHHNNDGPRNIKRKSNPDEISCCMAQNIHIEPGSSVRTDGTVDMYISFTLPFPDCKNLNVTITYDCSPAENTPPVTVPLTRFIQFESYENAWNTKPQPSSYIFHGLLEQLPASATDCWYQIQHHMDRDSKQPSSPDDNNLSPKITFTTPTTLGQPSTLAIVADWGQTTDSIHTMELIKNATIRKSNETILQNISLRTKKPIHNPPPLPVVSTLLVVGDLSYANGHLPSWETWLTSMQPLFQSTPLLVAAGNQELECDAHTYEIFRAYQHYFRTPNYHDPTDWRRFREGLAHVIVLNPYTPTNVGSVQYTWLQTVLQTEVDRTISPWLIVAFHCPFHTTFRGHNHEINSQIMKEAMEPLFLKYNVNVVFSGHQHSYVRSHPMRYGQVDTDGRSPIYMTVGTGGESHSLGPLHPRQGDWVAVRDHSTFGAGQLQLVNVTHAHWERLMDDTTDPSLRDSVWIVNYYTTTIKQIPSNEETLFQSDANTMETT
ncbi:calcineurin-like phosphoesterase [Nitzschia inconspicua]|uniref:Calcineurin-like phosphoesterase n=1 Tax=Nitzschia inconspicua TaxID=303405 RepID=A0A9K3M2J7_9STRA|nr:calcineurin-like phosphoesterase [Nitzschia inconspicua]